MQIGGRRIGLKGIIFSLFVLINFNIVLAQEGGGIVPAASHSVPSVNTYQFTGAAVASIPLLVPPGRNGLAPKLALTYNSYQKNGWIGIGWDLDLGAIQRSTKRGVCYECDDYVATMNGSASELVPRPDPDSNYYGAKIEGAFARYRYNGSSGWVANTKDGTKYYYGQSEDSRQNDPNSSSRVFKWCLDRVEDAIGNYMTASYTKHLGQIYLQKIEYTGYDGSNSLPPSNSIVFHLESDRPDRPRMYNTKFEVVTAKLLKFIEVRTLNNTVVRTYKLDYIFDNNTFQSSLEAVQHSVTFDEFGMPSVAPRVNSFTWSLGGDGSFDTGTPTDMTNALLNRYLGDYNGDGKMDILCVRESDGYAYVKFSRGDGEFDTGPPTDMTSTLTRRYPGDYNGDGKTDILCVRNSDGYAYVRFSRGNGEFDTGLPTDMTSTLSNRYPGDYNGDGKTDILCVRNSDGYAYVRFSRGNGEFDTGLPTDMTSTLNIRYLGDYNGDGLTDILCTRNSDGYAYVKFSRGNGEFDTGPPTDMTSALTNRYPGDYNGDGLTDILCARNSDGYAYVRFSKGDGTFSTLAATDMTSTLNIRYPGDYNGDGKTDVLCVRNSDGYAYVRFSRGDGTFDTLATTDMTSTLNIRYPGDYNGDGKTDVLCVRNSDGYSYVKISGGQVPNLLESLTSDMGGTTTFGYKNSSDYQNELLPFIVHPVSSITVDDGNAETEHTSTTYEYSDGYFDFATREFRGFQTVTQTHPNNTVQITNFYQGRDDSEALPGDNYYFKGRTANANFKETSGGNVLSETDFTLETYPENPENWAFVKLTHKRSESHDGVTTITEEDYVYDNENGNLISVTASGTGAESITKTFAYHNYGSEVDPIWRKKSENMEGTSSGLMRQAWFEYNSSGNLIEEEHWNNNSDDPTNPVIKIKYDAYGNQTESWGAKSSHLYPNSPTVNFHYDPETHTYPVRITNVLNHVVEYGYDYRYGKVRYEIDPNGVYTINDYDDFGRVIQTRVMNSDETEIFAQTDVDYYDDVFPRYVRTRVKEDNSGSTIDAYDYFDGLGRGIQSISFGENGTPIVSKTRFDVMGRMEQTWGPFFSTFIGYHSAGDIPGNIPYVKTEYDLRSRPIRIESPLGADVDSASNAVTTFSYSGLSITITDPDGGKKTDQKDYLGRIVQVTEYSDAGELYTDYQYNVAGELLKVTDAQGNETTISYDSLGRKIQMSDPDMDPDPTSEDGDWTYTYDLNGNLKTQTDAKNQTVSFSYDVLNRITLKTYNTSDPAVSYFYDEPSVQNGIGRLYKTENANASTQIDAYDPMGRESIVTQRITGAPLSAYTTTYSYDYSGKVKSINYPGTTPYQVNYDYHPGSGLLDTVTGITDFTEYAELSGYEPTGKIGEIVHGNGAQTFYGYDTKSTRLLSIQTTGPVMENIQNKAYKYTAAGDIARITDTKDAQIITYNYGYDKLHRLISETNTGAADNFDPAMLIKTYDNTAPIHAVKSVNLNGMDKPYEYDHNGNMTEGWDFSDPLLPVKRQIDYNADNMPVQIRHLRSSGTVTVDFSYDGEGVRVKKAIVGGSATYYIGNHFEVAGGIETKYIFAGNLRIAKVTSSTKQFFHKDHLGSTTVATSYPGGLEIETAEYLPFGLFRNHSETEVTYYKFTDQELDAETGLYNYNARLYDPAIGIFITPDSIVPDFSDPQTLNRYSYCKNNPLYYVDPSGHFPWVAVVAGAIIGAISSGAQSDWDPGAMAVGTVIGGVSGGVFSGVSGLIGGSIEGTIVGGAAAGATAGGLSAAYYGGDIGQSMLQGAGYGAIGGAAFGAIGFPNNPWKVAMYGGIGGGLSELAGGSFADGALISGGLALMGYGYYKFTTGRYPTGQTSSGDAIEKPADPKAAMEKMKQNPNSPHMGFAVESKLSVKWAARGTEQALKWIPNNAPIFNDISYMHDFFGYKIFANANVWKIANFPTMIPAAAWTLGGAVAFHSPSAAAISLNLRSDW